MQFSVIFHDHAKSSFLRILQEVIVPKVTIEIGVFEGETTFNITNLLGRAVKADFIYVDGSHFAKDVLSDAVFGFELLNIGGVMLFDDAVSWRYGEHIQDSPKVAVDAFIQCNWNRLRVLEMPGGYQTAIKRVS